MQEHQSYKTNGAPPVPIGGAMAKLEDAIINPRFFDDGDFQDKLLALIVYDKPSLERCAHLLTPDDFKPSRAIPSGRPRWTIAERALEYWDKHHEPIGKLIRADALKYANDLNLGSSIINELRAYLKHLKTIDLTAPEAITGQVVEYKGQFLKKNAIDDLADLESAGKLTDEKWESVMLSVLKSTGFVSKPDPLLEAPQWPEDLKEDAYYGLAGDIVRAIEPRCEINPPTLLLESLAACGNVIGRGPYWMYGATRHALNLFVGIIGDTGIGKGSGLDHVMSIFHEVDTKWSENPNINAGLSSGEGFIKMVRDATIIRDKNGKPKIVDPGVADKRLLIIQPEFAQVLEVMERSGNTLCAKLRNAWDGKPLANNSLSSHLTATGAHISMIVQSTEADLRDLMSRTMLLNGTGNRFLWVPARRVRSMPFGKSVPWQTRNTLVERLRDVVAFARTLIKSKTRGRLKFDRNAHTLWLSVYDSVLMRDSANPVTGRAAAQVRRMATIYAVMDCCPRVRDVHLAAALAAWDYCAAGARFTFGGVHRTDPATEKLREALMASGKAGLTRKQINVDVFARNKSADEITRMLGGLQKQGHVRMRPEPAAPQGGRPAERWFAV